MEVTPGAGEKDYWECEKKNKTKPNFVRHPTLPKIDTTKVGVSAREVLFAGLKFKSLDRVTVKIYDVEKDGTFDKVVRGALKLAFPLAVNILSAGTAITVGNILAELKKKSGKDEDRSDVEKKFNEVIDSTKKAGKSRLIWTHSADIEAITCRRLLRGHRQFSTRNLHGRFRVKNKTEKLRGRFLKSERLCRRKRHSL